LKSRSKASSTSALFRSGDVAVMSSPWLTK
jgi:hypothetical protein